MSSSPSTFRLFGEKKSPDMTDGKGLVDYSSSDSDDGREPLAAPTALGKRKRLDDCQSDLLVRPRERSQLPPLPPRFHDLYVSASRASIGDDPSLHGGRLRAIPHVDGNWATHIYLECMSPHKSRTHHCSVTIALLFSLLQSRVYPGPIDAVGVLT